MPHRVALGCGALALALALMPGAAGAQVALPPLPATDLQGAFTFFGMQTPLRVAVQRNAEPPLAPAPRAVCDAASEPLAGMQGRVPPSAIASPQASRGWTCNLEPVSHHATPGGFRVWRYQDAAGHVCAFYDTSLLAPLNVISLAGGPGLGVVVLDMADPAHPRQTALLTDPGMLSPHESVNLNAKRGLLAAETANVGTGPSILSVFDVSRDCRAPERLSNTYVGPVGHESGFSPDGRTFWIGGVQGIIAVDVSDPRAPRTIWTGNEFAHGLNLSDDGNTLYDTNAVDGGLTILDVSEIQARRENPQAYEISRLIWDSASIPQNTNPMTIDGHRYLLEFDEFALRFNPLTIDDRVGAARIIDIADRAHPRVVSNLRLEVNQRAEHKAADGDASFVPGSQTTYAAHYCNIPREVDPEIVACSFLNSGLRIFDIRNPEHPREVAYFVSPPGTSQGQKADAAFSQPAFDPEHRQVWFSDATTGFWAVRLRDRVWPHPLRPASCPATRQLVITVRRPRHGRIRSVVAHADGRRVRARRAGRRVVVRAAPGARVTLVVRTTRGTRTVYRRTVKRC